VLAVSSIHGLILALLSVDCERTVSDGGNGQHSPTQKRDPGGQHFCTLRAALTDRERGLLAGALLAACGDTAAAATPVVGPLRLDSADPSLMSRADVARLWAHLRSTDPAALQRALRTLAERPAMVAMLDGLFAPSRGSSDTSTLGGDPTDEGAARGA
jgi:hypothetical protein